MFANTYIAIAVFSPLEELCSLKSYIAIFLMDYYTLEKKKVKE